VTITACYLSPEGVVLGADSTSTYRLSGGEHHFNYAQKLFEIGDGGTFGIVTWGLGGLSVGSHRTAVAKLADSLKESPPVTINDVATRWIDLFWVNYSASLAGEIQTVRTLRGKLPFDMTGQTPGSRTIDEEMLLLQLSNNLVVGFCLGGYMVSDRNPVAFEILFRPDGIKPSLSMLSYGHSFWGMPALIGRLILGCAEEVREEILNSGKWQGTPAELDSIISKYSLSHPQSVPIREAIDFTHACLLTTIKAMKFSHQPQRCGGPIEIAVITTDRPFRWVLHKTWDSAIREGEPHDARVIPNTAGGGWPPYAR
jgi:hypothetical protein